MSEKKFDEYLDGYFGFTVISSFFIAAAVYTLWGFFPAVSYVLTAWGVIPTLVCALRRERIAREASEHALAAHESYYACFISHMPEERK